MLEESYARMAEANAQAEAQEKKDEAEVQVSQPVHLRRLQEQK